jgi:hypothetical protein
MKIRWIMLALGALALSAPSVRGAEHQVLGYAFQVKDPKAGVDPSRRKVVVNAKESSSGAALVGDPTADGGSLALEADGESDVIAMPAGGWKATRSGFAYADRDGLLGTVRMATIKRSSSGTFAMKAVVSGKFGTIEVVPPNPGTEGAAAIAINFGDAYCAHFGGVAGGLVINDGPRLFTVKKPTATGPCPSVLNPTTTTTSTTSTTGAPVCGNGVREGSEVCDGSDLGSCPAGISQCAPPGGACPACDCCVAPGGQGPSLSACCCDGSPCVSIGPGTCVCAPLCGSQPFPTCGAVCDGGLNCSAYRVDGVDQCLCVQIAPGPCDTTCGGDCPNGFVCAVDSQTQTCGCIAQ